MSDCKPIGTPAETNSHLPKHETEEKHPLYAKLVGKLMFAFNTRFDIAYSDTHVYKGLTISSMN